LDIKTRELVTLSILIALGGGALLTVITQLLPWAGYPRTLNALKCLNEVMPK